MKNRHRRVCRSARLLAVVGLALIGGTGLAAAQDAPKVETAAQQPPEAKISPKVLAKWRGNVVAHLAAHKRAIGNGAAGVATVAFRIDRSGRVLSAQIVKSSGSAALDKEAVALTERASPVPAPPADLSGSKLYLKVPISFAR